MNASVLQENFSKAISGVSRIVSTRPSLPILSNVLLRTEKGKLSVIGTDLTTSLVLEMGGKIEKEGSVTVPARDLAAFVATLPPGKIELSSDDVSLSIRSGLSRARLLGVAATEFPTIDIPRDKGVSVLRERILGALRNTLFAVAADESRPILTGIKIAPVARKSGNLMVLTATDGFRLSVVEVGVDGAPFESPCVVPGRTLSELARVASGESVSLVVTSDGVAFSFEGGWVLGRLLAGEFPPAERIIPERSDLVVTMDRVELERAVRAAAVFARDSANIVRWIVKDGELTISANSPQIGENETRLSVSGVGSGPSESEGREIAFNARYLLDWIGSVNSEQIEFGMSGPLKPGVFRPVGDKSYTHVIMPVRTQKEESSG